MGLVLVVPEHHLNRKIPLLVRTNILDRLYQHGIGSNGLKSLFCVHSDCSYAQIFQHIAQAHETTKHLHIVKLQGSKALTIPAQYKLCTTRIIRVGKTTHNTDFVLKPNEHHPLPGGLFLESALVNVLCEASCKVLIVLCNMSNHNITLHRRSVLAQISVAQCVTLFDLDRHSPSESESLTGLGLTWRLRLSLNNGKHTSQKNLTAFLGCLPQMI